MRFRYSIRVLLLVCTVLAMLMALISERAVRQMRISRLITSQGGEVHYRSGVLNLWPDDGIVFHFFSGVSSVAIRPTRTHTADEQLAMVADLPTRISELSIYAVLLEVQGVDHRTFLPLSPITDKGLEIIRQRLFFVKRLEIPFTYGCSDDAIRMLKNDFHEAQLILEHQQWRY